MIKRLWGIALLLVTMTTIFVSCSNEDDTNPTQFTEAILSVQIPKDLKDAKIEELKAEVTNVQTNKTETITDFKKEDDTYTSKHPFQNGSYNVVLTGKLSYNSEDGTAQQTPIRTEQKGVQLSSQNATQTVKLIPEAFTAGSGFVISEIFFTQARTKEDKAYSFAQYIRITNNSDQTLYADSLALIISADISSMKRDYTEDHRKDSFFAGTLYTIPGKGKDVPVEAGKSLVIAFNGKDHTSFATNVPDLSHADFEIYEVSSNRTVDEDNPNVPNLNVWFKESASLTVLHQSGVKSLALAHMQKSQENFLKENHYTAKYIFKSGTFSKEMKQEGYLVPNSWIIDAVNLGMKDQYEWNIISPVLDSGFTYCLKNQKDKEGIGKSVMRKQIGNKLVDTNNSTNDFLPLQKPSLIK